TSRHPAFCTSSHWLSIDGMPPGPASIARRGNGDVVREAGLVPADPSVVSRPEALSWSEPACSLPAGGPLGSRLVLEGPDQVKKTTTSGRLAPLKLCNRYWLAASVPASKRSLELVTRW